MQNFLRELLARQKDGIEKADINILTIISWVMLREKVTIMFAGQ
jgi:hypothetical protein